MYHCNSTKYSGVNVIFVFCAPCTCILYILLNTMLLTHCCVYFLSEPEGLSEISKSHSSEWSWFSSLWRRFCIHNQFCCFVLGPKKLYYMAFQHGQPRRKRAVCSLREPSRGKWDGMREMSWRGLFGLDLHHQGRCGTREDLGGSGGERTKAVAQQCWVKEGWLCNTCHFTSCHRFHLGYATRRTWPRTQMTLQFLEWISKNKFGNYHTLIKFFPLVYISVKRFSCSCLLEEMNSAKRLDSLSSCLFRQPKARKQTPQRDNGLGCPKAVISLVNSVIWILKRFMNICEMSGILWGKGDLVRLWWTTYIFRSFLSMIL